MIATSCTVDVNGTLYILLGLMWLAFLVLYFKAGRR